MSRERVAVPRGRRLLLYLLPLLSLALAMLACGFSVSSRIGYHPPPVTHLPASALRLAIQISGQYDDTSKPDVFINIGVFDAASAQEFTFPESARLSCNGNAVTRTSATPGGNLTFPCPRQPPGGAYRIAYTNEHGATTTVVMPVPLGSFAIVSPQAGAFVPIPANGALAVRYILPTPPPNGSVAVDSVTVACSISLSQPCGAVYANLHPDATPTPYGGFAPATATPFRGPPTPTPIPGRPTATVYENRRPPTPTPNAGYGTPIAGATPRPTSPTMPGPMPTVSVTQHGDTGTVLLTGDYSMFQPATGILSLSVEAHVTPERGDFAAVTAMYSDMLMSYFTWTHLVVHSLNQ
jgi:hypothetical protein